MKAGMKITLYDYCREAGRTELIQQWDTEKNEGFSPHDVSYGSRKKAWWRCAKGHEWEIMIKERTYGKGCPVCANRVVIPGINDLATTHPQLAAEWHPTKNGITSPKTISYGTKKKVWWICDKGHEWEATILSRSYGAGCPVCSGKAVIPGENDMASMYPKIASEWHPSKNGNLRPDAVTPYSNRKVWWLCDKGHEYQAIISHRTGIGGGCPYCANRKVLMGFNDLATVHPKIAAQWHPTLNGSLGPGMVISGSAKKVWWQCDEGHVWKAVVYSRTGPDKCGCPVCAGKVNDKRVRRYQDILTEKKLEMRMNENSGFQ